MSSSSLGRALLAVAVLLLTAGCPKTSKDEGPRADGGAVTISCATDRLNCEEHPSPTAEQEQALRVVCSSGSGAFAKPAACPKAHFHGKCTFTADNVLRIRRYYDGPGVDIAYQQDFCVNTAHGTWSTTF